MHLKENVYTCFHCNHGFAIKRVLKNHLQRCPKKPPKLKATPKKTSNPPNNVTPEQRTMPQLEPDRVSILLPSKLGSSSNIKPKCTEINLYHH